MDTLLALPRSVLAFYGRLARGALNTGLAAAGLTVGLTEGLTVACLEAAVRTVQV